jgi:hypothetical protein
MRTRSRISLAVPTLAAPFVAALLLISGWHIVSTTMAAAGPAVVGQQLCGRAPAVPPDIPFGNTVRTDNPTTGALEVQAVCATGARGGWTIHAILRRERSSQVFVSPRPLPFSQPVAILAVYYFTSSELPAVLAQVGVGMTGQPYELFTFARDHHVAPAQMQFTADFGGLFGGGAALHGQGVFCGRHNRVLVITQVRWNIEVPFKLVPFDGGQTPAPTDPVTVSYEQWKLAGQPLHQVGRHSLPATKTTYRKAQALENAHC